jgi:ParB family chromosome partitioning protein
MTEELVNAPNLPTPIYSQAKKAIAEARTIDDVKEVRNKAIAMRAYAEQAKDTQMEKDAIFIRLRAERRIGEMLREGKDDRASVGGNRRGIEIDPGDVLMLDSDGSWSSAETKDDCSEPSSSDGFLENPSKPTLEQVGIDKNLAQRARALAKMSDEEFEKHAEEYVQRSLKPRGTAGTGEFERYTPSQYIERARTVMRSIDLDPASCDTAQAIVKATTFYTIFDDGLSKEWNGNVWLNPPYHRELGPRFVNKLVTELATGRIKQAIMLTNNSTDTDWFQEAVSACQAVCFVKGRIKFLKSDGVRELFPTQGQAFFYYGTDVERFCSEFCKIGFIATVFRSYSGA